MKNGLNVILMLVAAVAVVFGVRSWRKAESLSAESRVLRAQVNDMEKALEESREASRGSERSGAEAQAQLRELMKLRNEVTQLRQSRDAGVRAEEELKRVRAEAQRARSTGQVEVQAHARGSIPREEWRFAGYETPESALISGLWAMKEGQLQSVLGSVTPEEAQRMQTELNLQSDVEVANRFQKEFGAVTGLQVVGDNRTAGGEAVLDVYLEGVGALKRFRVNQVGNEWKLGGPVEQNPVSNSGNGQDPLSFYRRNPELMKRYFPHLINQGAAQPSQPGE